MIKFRVWGPFIAIHIDGLAGTPLGAAWLIRLALTDQKKKIINK